MKIKRTIQKQVLKLAKKFPVVLITGPRQSGKTTLSKMTFPNYVYYNLEDPSVLSVIKNDPKEILQNSKIGIIIDEAQKFPEIFSYIQVFVDEHKERGKIILTGSENLALSERISQSLAGRVVTFTLLPFSINELKKTKFSNLGLNEYILKGFYPAKLVENIDTNIYYSNYIANYIERDVRQLKNIGDLSLFSRFLQLLAGNVGQMLNLESIANDIGIDRKTALSWLSILEASYIVFLLAPYYKNWGKRLTKRSKLYFYDNGIVSYLLGIKQLKEVDVHFARGALFENLIISELYKEKFNNYYAANFWFWRDNNAVEVDLLIDKGTSLLPIEIKVSQTFNISFLRNINLFKSYVNNSNIYPYIVYAGKEEFSLNGSEVIKWNDLKYKQLLSDSAH
jgi:hypothetical protein